MVDFSAYLNVVCTDRDYCDTRSHYTTTDALLPLEARVIERQKPDSEESESSRKQFKRLAVLEGLRSLLSEKREHLLLAGRPGSGKSTTLKLLLLELAETALTDATQRIPVLLELKGDRSIFDLMIAAFRPAKQRVTVKQIDDWLLEDRLVLLLDGINEIPSDKLRRKLQTFRNDNPTTPMIFTTRGLAIGGDLGIETRLEMCPLTESQMREFVQKYLPEHGEMLLRQLNDRLREVAETPLLLRMLCDVFKSNRQQIPQSKGALFRSFDRDYRHIKREIQAVPVSKNFWNFKSEVLQHLALIMIQADVQQSTEAWLTCILEKWLTERGLTDAPTQAKLWLEDLQKHDLLQVAADLQQLEFHHQLFQEYYAAEALLVMLQDKHPDVKDNKRFQHFYLNYLKWTEPIAIMVSLITEKQDVLRIVQLALDVSLQLGATLAGKVNQDFQKKAIDLISKHKVTQNFLFLPWFKRRVNLPQKVIIQLLGDTQSDQAIRCLKEIIHRQKSLRHQDILDTTGSATFLNQLKTLLNKALSRLLGSPVLSRAEYREILGMALMTIRRIGSEEALRSLIELSFHYSYHPYGLDPDTIDAVAKYGSEKEISNLCQLNDYMYPAGSDDERQNHRRTFWMFFAHSLARYRPEAAIPILKQWLQDDQMPLGERILIVELLSKIGSDQAILTLKESYDWILILEPRKAAVRSLENRYALENSYDNTILQVASGVRKADRDSEAYFLYYSNHFSLPDIIQAILHRHAQYVTPLLSARTLLHRADPQARVMGKELLQTFPPETITLEVWQALLHGYLPVRLPALMNLNPTRCEADKWVLQKALNDQNRFVQDVAAIKLGKFRPQEEVSFWTRILHIAILEDNWSGKISKFSRKIAYVISSFWKALWRSFRSRDPAHCVAFLEKVIEDESAIANYGIYQLAVEELSKIRSKPAIAALCTAMHSGVKDGSQYFRVTAVKALQKMGSRQMVSRQAVEALLQQGLTSSHWDVRSHAANALGLLATASGRDIASKADMYEKGLPALLKLFQDDSSDVRFSAAVAVGAIAKPQRLSALANLIPTRMGYEALSAMSAIQSRCQFYNYDIKQLKLPTLSQKQSPNPGQPPVFNFNHVEQVTIMPGQNTFNQQHATIGVNNAEAGSNPNVTQNIQNTQ